MREFIALTNSETHCRVLIPVDSIRFVEDVVSARPAVEDGKQVDPHPRHLSWERSETASAFGKACASLSGWDGPTSERYLYTRVFWGIDNAWAVVEESADRIACLLRGEE